VVGFTIVSRGEVPGKRKPVIKEQTQHDDYDDTLCSEKCKSAVLSRMYFSKRIIKEERKHV
jgi:hypothetical protein